MDESEFEKYLEERYNDQIGWYETKSADNKKKYQIFELILIIVSSLTPVLIVIDFIAETLIILRWISVITSVLTVITASLLRSFEFHEKWLNYRTTAELLKKEIYYYKANTEEYAQAEDKEALFVDRVENLISKSNKSWLEDQKRPSEADINI